MERNLIISQLIVVEGKNDAHVIRRALGNVDVIWTDGFGLTSDKLDYISKMAEKRGVIVCTDPDYEGEKIRQRISKKVPSAQHVYLSKINALNKKGDDIGWENASIEEIIKAFSKIQQTVIPEDSQQRSGDLTLQDLIDTGLAGSSQSAQKRAQAGKILGIGDTNAKQFVYRANRFGLKKDDLLQAVSKVKADICHEFKS